MQYHAALLESCLLDEIEAFSSCFSDVSRDVEPVEDRFLEWEEVFESERELIAQKLRAREAVGWRGGRKTFSVALSGGGVRAAAFQWGGAVENASIEAFEIF